VPVALEMSSFFNRVIFSGHGGWVTSLAVGEEEVNGERVEFLLSGSRDKTLIRWELDDKKDDDEDRELGTPKKMFTGKSKRAV